MRIPGEKIFRYYMQVGEVAASAAGYAYAFAQFRHVIYQQHATTAFCGCRSAHHAGGTGANHNDIKFHQAQIVQAAPSFQSVMSKVTESRVKQKRARRVTVRMTGGGQATVVQPVDARCKNGMNVLIERDGETGPVVPRQGALLAGACAPLPALCGRGGSF